MLLTEMVSHTSIGLVYVCITFSFQSFSSQESLSVILDHRLQPSRLPTRVSFKCSGCKCFYFNRYDLASYNLMQDFHRYFIWKQICSVNSIHLTRQFSWWSEILISEFMSHAFYSQKILNIQILVNQKCMIKQSWKKTILAMIYVIQLWSTSYVVLKVEAAPNLCSLPSVSDSSSPESIGSTAVGEQEIFEAGAQRETGFVSTLPATCSMHFAVQSPVVSITACLNGRISTIVFDSSDGNGCSQGSPSSLM